MAKAKVHKVKSKLPSVKSRAARRATSPSIDVDKSIKDAKPLPETEALPAVLAARNDAGIWKKKKQKPMSRQQRLRQEKGLQRADIVIDKLENRVKRSKTKAKIIKDRAADWDDLNSAGGPKRKELKKSTSSKTKRPTDDIMEGVVQDNDTAVRQTISTASGGPFDALDEIT